MQKSAEKISALSVSVGKADRDALGKIFRRQAGIHPEQGGDGQVICNGYGFQGFVFLQGDGGGKIAGEIAFRNAHHVPCLQGVQIGIGIGSLQGVIA